MVNNAGSLVVSYTYEAWGNILSVSGSKASTLGSWNPLRYRGYVYDNETGLYYLQSRYYNPKIGRFINADVFVSTGQDLLGNNMFAYCLNNPVNGCDPCGTCFHRWDFWNDCEKCGGITIGDKRKAVTTWCTETYDTINSVHQQQVQLETQITMQQNEMIANGAKTMWNAYEHSNELQVQQQYQQDMTVRKVADFLEDNPEIAIDVATGTIGTGLTYVGLGATVAGVSIPVAGQIAMGVVGTVCGIWGLYRLGETIYQYIY